MVGPWSFFIKEVQRKSKKAKGVRMDYLALPSDNEHDYRLHVKELMMSIMYEHLERWVKLGMVAAVGYYLSSVMTGPLCEV